MTALLLLLAMFLSGAEAHLTVDLDGQGVAQTATAVIDGRAVRLDIRDAKGKLLAKADAPAPERGAETVALASGSLGSAGALLEVVATAAGAECRSLWRYREGSLTQAPLAVESGALPDCAKPEWARRWERPDEGAPALYVRERSTRRPNGTLREVEVFRYAGFRLAVDRERSSAWINGVEIPRWRSVTLYPSPALEGLSSRFDLGRIRASPRLHIVADRANGIFEVVADDGSRRERLPVTAVSPTEKPRERVLTAGPGKASVRVLLSAAGTMPVEADFKEAGAARDRVYVAVQRAEGSRVAFYGSAEEELAQLYLAGLWDAGGQQIAVTAGASPAAVKFGAGEFTLSIADAPAGVDVLLVPRDGSLPGSGIQLRGQNLFLETLVHCRAGTAAGSFACDTPVPGRKFRRVGGRLNVG